MRRAEFCRGAALAETVVVLAFALVILFAIMQLATVGYLQISGDAATFFAAHEYTLGVSQSTIQSELSTMAPGFVAAAVTFSPEPPPSIDPSIFTNIYGTMGASNRHGGYTLVRPQNFAVLLNQTGTSAALFNGVFGFNTKTPISSGAVEGYYLMTENQMDEFGVDPNSDLGGNILNSAYASPFLPQSDAQIANMNTPPYYVPATYSKVCTVPWQGANNAGGSFGELCYGANGSGDVPWYLGLGEYLSNYNYDATAMGVNYGQVFNAMAAHQRAYADLLAAFPDLSAMTAANEDDLLAKIQFQFQNYTPTAYAGPITNKVCTVQASPSSTACGANFLPPTTFPNGGNCPSGTAPQQPLYWYDSMLWWEREGSRTAPTGWTLHPMWGTESGIAVSNDPGGLSDGLEGPNCGATTGNAGAWNGATFSMVSSWDQPNIPGSAQIPGNYPTEPLQGSQVTGDPLY